MSISLKPHNVEAYKKISEMFKSSNRAAVIHPTGTGKMFIALKLLEENKEKKAIYLSPSNPILHDVKKNIFAEGMTMQDFPNLRRMTYQKLMNLSDEEIEKLDVDIIVLDEFHHCGAPEWGKGVERLLEQNGNAKILGLSATPLRYFDGLRDMADELFEDNIASEMSLEDAINQGILPEATYVSTLLGYEQELENMQSNIDKIKGTRKKEEAQGLLDTLRKKLDENTEHLPEVFSEYMQNKSGKYIVFCKNIEDMNEKMAAAQEMFGKVNPNITVRAVSSKIKTSDKVLTEFEQDTDENTLKLLYAVDMLNEGYHISDLDGVVMMRPTFSPTIYTQQLGRALTVGSKRPVVLDLVNNFDSCKIIEDFAEKMKQYKDSKGTGTRKKGKSRISIIDKTKEFREIAEKITELSKGRSISLEEKLQIFERFYQTGEEISGNTIFEGHPIGTWAINLRSSINRANNGKDKINISEDQLTRLESMGLLERGIDSTINEKIDALIAWIEKYPKAKISSKPPRKVLIEYSKEGADYKQLLEEYEKMQKYYEYIRHRKYQGKLSDEQLLKCKEGNIGSTFGYSTQIELLAKQYGRTEKDIDYILSNYGTMDNFYNLFKQQKLKNTQDKLLARSIINNVIDIDFDPNSSCYDDLYRFIVDKKDEDTSLSLYSSKRLNDALQELNEREQYLLEMKFRLTGEDSSKSLVKLGEDLGLSPNRIAQILHKARRRLLAKLPNYTYSLGNFMDSEFLTDSERAELSKLEENLNILNLSNLQGLRNNSDVLRGFEVLKPLRQNIKERELEAKARARVMARAEVRADSPSLIEAKVRAEKVAIESLDLSFRTFNVLTRAGITTLGQVSNLTEEELLSIRNLGRKSSEEIIATLEEFGLQLKEPPSEEKTAEQLDPLSLDNLNLSPRSYNCLIKAGFTSLDQVANLTLKELEKLRNIGPKSVNEIVYKLEKFGFHLSDLAVLATSPEGKSSEKPDQVQEESEESIEASDKSALVRRILEKQETIRNQQAEIEQLRNNQKKEL